MSKTYILLKDTPFNKAGTEFFTTNGNSFSTVGYPVNTLESFTEQDILERPQWFKLKETPKRGRPKKSYTPKVGDTVRVVESRGKKANKFIGKQGKVVMDLFGGYMIDVGDDVYNCFATKVEPVEKKQLPSKRIGEIADELNKTVRLKHTAGEVYAMAITIYLNEQHLAGEKGSK